MGDWRPPEKPGGPGEPGESREPCQSREPAQAASVPQAPESPEPAMPAASPEPEGKAALAARQIDRWIAQMDRLRLADYVRYADDKRRVFWSNFLGGVARGVGMAVGFTILGAVLVLILQNLAKRNLPLIGDALAQIVSIVQKRLE